jgi:hypothetical protein
MCQDQQQQQARPVKQRNKARKSEQKTDDNKQDALLGLLHTLIAEVKKSPAPRPVEDETEGKKNEDDDESMPDPEKACSHAVAMCVRCGFCRLCHNRRRKRKLPGWKHEFLSRSGREQLRLHGTVVSLKHAHIEQERLIQENAILKRKLAASEYGYTFQ